jgi:hypothetical protein
MDCIKKRSVFLFCFILFYFRSYRQIKLRNSEYVNLIEFIYFILGCLDGLNLEIVSFFIYFRSSG